MTMSGDFMPVDDDQAFEGPTYPVAFGVELTPRVSGIIIGLAGIALSAWVFSRFVQPVLQGNAELRDTIALKQAELEQQRASLANIEELEAKLDQTIEKRAKVYALFAKPETLNTLLIDTNSRIKEVNSGVDAAERRIRELGQNPVVIDAALTGFAPDPEASGVVEDGSLGTAVNGKLRREVVNVGLEGKFGQLQSIMRNIERLEPLLIIKEFEAVLEDDPQFLTVNEDNEVQTVSGSEEIQETVLVDGKVVRQPWTNLQTTFKLEALVPTGSVDELPEVTPTPAEAPPAEGEVPAE